MTRLSRPPSGPEIDIQSIRVFCDILFGYLDGLVPVRVLSEKGTAGRKPWTPFYPVSNVVSQLGAVAQEAADRHSAVYVVPGTVRMAGSARAEDILQTGVLLIDLDDGDIEVKTEWLVRHIGPSPMILASGGRMPTGAVLVVPRSQPKSLGGFWTTRAAWGRGAALGLFKRTELRDVLVLDVRKRFAGSLVPG